MIARQISNCIDSEISANATTINMTKFPIQPTEEGSIVEYVCEAQYPCYSDPPAVLWFVGNKSVHASDIYPVEYYTSPWTYSEMTKSTLRLLMERKLNNKQVICALGNDSSKLNDDYLHVICKYVFVLV